MFREHRVAVVFALSVLVAGCGGGGGAADGEVSGLTIPSKMTVIEASATAAATHGTIVGSDYQTDQTRFYVHDEALAALDTINEILRSLGQTHYDDPAVVNAGPYIALIEVEKDGGDNGAAAGGQQGEQQGGAAEEPALEEWVVSSTRESEDAPHVVRFWIDWVEDQGPSGGVPARLYARLTIYDGVSAKTPFGRFVLHFKLLPRTAPDTSTDAVLFRGTLKTVDRQDGQLEYSFFTEKGDVNASPALGEEAFLQEARVVSDASRTEGRAYTKMRSVRNDGSGIQAYGVEFHLAFNQRYVARKAVRQTEVVEVLDRQIFDTFIWRYGLYDTTTESRVQRSSGFGFRTDSGAHGWVGYHGLWAPPEVQLANGDSVLREQQTEGAAPEVYTIFTAPGRLVRRTRSSVTLADVKGETLYGWHPGLQASVMIQWDGSDLMAVAQHDDQTQQWVPIQPTESLNAQYGPGDWAWFWSEARGEVSFPWPQQGDPTDATQANVFEEVVVTGNAPELAGGDLTLYAVHRAPKPLIAASDLTWQGDGPFFPDAQTVGEQRTYVFDADTLTLGYQGSPVRLADGVTVSEGGAYYFGVSSGPLLPAPITDMAAVGSADVSYRWDTGQHDWNQLRTVKDAQGAFVAFDPPMGFSYTHHDAQDPDHNGRTYWLEYQGFGELHGIPHRQVGPDRWIPELNLAAGTVLTNDDGSFLVKPLEGEQVLRAVQNPQQTMVAEGLDFDTTLTPPDHGWSDPVIGPKPGVDAAPRFIAGEPQAE